MKDVIEHLGKMAALAVLLCVLTGSGCAAVQAGEGRGTDSAARDARDAAWIQSDSPFVEDR